ncbi:MAG: Uma2 family endonuclease [Deltaproteobacteria bacterium]|nr:Uma2 family endonuclease [Deltaproteobacteria bacterium]
MQSTQVVVRHRLLTVEDYHKMGEAGILHEDDRVELVDGELIEMAPIGSDHSGTVIQLTALVSAALVGQALLSTQNPVRLGKYSEPQPDIAILRLRDDFYRKAHPRPEDVLMLIEVADTTVHYDREVKIPLYARHGVPEVWLIDLQQECIEIYLQPSSAGYLQILRPGKDERISPSLLPDISILVADLWSR